MPIELNNPIPLQCWTEYWKAREILDQYEFQEIENEEREQLFKRLQLFEEKYKIN